MCYEVGPKFERSVTLLWQKEPWPIFLCLLYKMILTQGMHKLILLCVMSLLNVSSASVIAEHVLPVQIFQL